MIERTRSGADTSITNERLRTMIDAAAKATSGPWLPEKHTFSDYVVATIPEAPTLPVARLDKSDARPTRLEDAAHIANMDPATTIRICKELLDLRNERADAARRYNTCSRDGCSATLDHLPRRPIFCCNACDTRGWWARFKEKLLLLFSPYPRV